MLSSFLIDLHLNASKRSSLLDVTEHLSEFDVGVIDLVCYAARVAHAVQDVVVALDWLDA